MSFRSIWNPAVDAVVGEAGEKGLESAGDRLLERSLAVVPRLTNALADSAQVVEDRGDVVVSYTSPYAVVQHEDTTYRHDAGKQAKFLEGPLDQEHDDLLGRVASGLRKVMPRWMG